MRRVAERCESLDPSGLALAVLVLLVEASILAMWLCGWFW